MKKLVFSLTLLLAAWGGNNQRPSNESIKTNEMTKHDYYWNTHNNLETLKLQK